MKKMIFIPVMLALSSFSVNWAAEKIESPKVETNSQNPWGYPAMTHGQAYQQSVIALKQQYPNDQFLGVLPQAPQQDPLELLRQTVYEYSYFTEDCAYIIRGTRRTFFGMPYGKIHHEVIRVGCV